MKLEVMESHMLDGSGTRRGSGFTLVELIVVIAIVALLVSLVAPRFIGALDRSKEAVLHTNLSLLRESIDRHYADQLVYPAGLDDLVTKRYLREIPLDPITEKRDSWISVGHPAGLPGVYDISSGAPGISSDGRTYDKW